MVASTLREEVTGILLLPRLRSVERLGIEYAEAPPAAIRTQAAVTFTIVIDCTINNMYLELGKIDGKLR